MKEKDAKYPFMRSNTDRSDKGGMHWWSILDLHPKTEKRTFCSNLKNPGNKVTLAETNTRMQENSKNGIREIKHNS